MKADNMLFREKSRGNCYKFLSDCYYLPKSDLAKKLADLERAINSNFEEVVEDISNIDEGYTLGNNEALSGEIELRKIDHARLFVGPYALLAPPYGSIYLEGEGRIMGNSTLDVENWYREEGLDIGSKDAPDHITAELEFMYFLIFKEVEAIENSDSEKTAYYLKKQISFLETHLGSWVSEFADKIKKNAETEFYKNLSRATKSLIKKDMTELTKKFIDLGFIEATSNEVHT